jgi:hypothetical protein
LAETFANSVPFHYFHDMCNVLMLSNNILIFTDKFLTIQINFFITQFTELIIRLPFNLILIYRITCLIIHTKEKHNTHKQKTVYSSFFKKYHFKYFLIFSLNYIKYYFTQKNNIHTNLFINFMYSAITIYCSESPHYVMTIVVSCLTF